MNEETPKAEVTINEVEYINLISAESLLIKSHDGKVGMHGLSVGKLVTFIEEPFGYENKGVICEIAKNGVFIDDGSGFEKYCSFKLRSISSKLKGVALVHNTNS